MQINAKFNNLTKIRGTSNLVQGVKRGRTPAHAVAGGNGSFIVAERAKLILSLKCDDGTCVQKDIYTDVKSYSDKNITENYKKVIENKLKDFDFVVEDGRILNLGAALSSLN